MDKGRRIMPSARVSLLLLLLVVASCAEGTSTTTEAPGATNSSSGGKIARRIVDDRLSPPARTTEFAAWNKRLPPLGEIHHRLSASPPRVTEELLDDNATENARPKKTRTVGPSARDPNCCGEEPDKLTGDKIKSSQQLQADDDELDVERGNGVGGPAPRYHGNRPYEDRYGSSGWKSSSYLGYGKDRNYYDQRNHYAYDRYGAVQRPSAAVDGDRYPSSPAQQQQQQQQQRPVGSSSSQNGDRYGTASGDRFGASSGGNRPSASYQAIGGGYGGYGNNRRPGYGGTSGSLEEPEAAEYPFEGEPAGPAGPNIANLQTQKAVALKALAGVALIGAAAALASNPVLLPISVFSGRRRRRRKRSAGFEIESDNFALTALLQGYIKPKEPNEQVAEDRQQRGAQSSAPSNSSSSSSGGSQELVISPQCVARLACHVHRDYLDELDKSRAELLKSRSDQQQPGPGDADVGAAKGNNNNNNNNVTEDAAAALSGLEHWFDSLIHSNILVADYLSDELKSLIQSAVIVGSNRNETCDQFSCLNNNEHESSQKKKDN